MILSNQKTTQYPQYSGQVAVHAEHMETGQTLVALHEVVLQQSSLSNLSIISICLLLGLLELIRWQEDPDRTSRQPLFVLPYICNFGYEGSTIATKSRLNIFSM